ncbi:MAG TPA: prepilin-type N-terminal cleavage/methylation domain-containing protein [Candidatus Acidoferrum sp.]|nr:prepilin-type N-terminal cleavage/methylation domain-containing protein [Candidatus Acidoferrum sp.]
MDDHNNQGFTLIEALVTFMLIAVIGTSLLGITHTGASSYRSVSNEMSVQYESQIVMSQIEEYVISCNAGIYWTAANHTLRVAVRDEADDDEAHYTVHFFKWEPDAQQINYASQPVTINEDSGIATCDEPSASDWALMGSRVTGFSAEQVRSSMRLELGVTMGNKSYTTKSVTAMRNEVIIGADSVGTDYDEWLQAVCAPEE